MRTTELKHKRVTTFDCAREQTPAQKEAEIKRIAERKANPPKVQHRYLTAPVSAEEMADDEILSSYVGDTEKTVAKIQEEHPRYPHIYIERPQWGPSDLSWCEELIDPSLTKDRRAPDKVGSMLNPSEETIPARSIVLHFQFREADYVSIRIESKVTHWINDKWDKDGYYESLDTINITIYKRNSRIPISSGLVFIKTVEMEQGIVALDEDGSPKLAQEVFNALRVDLDPKIWPVPIYRKLATLNRCHQCGRALSDPISKVLQIGPTCAKKIGIDHSKKLAALVLQGA